MLRNFAAAAVAASTLALAAPAAHAALVVATYTGTASGVDNLGYFGDAGTSYAGTAFTATFTYDTTLGTRSTVGGSDVLTKSGTNPFTNVSFTLGDTTFTFAQIDNASTGVQPASGYVSTSVINVDPGGTFEVPKLFAQQLNLLAAFTPLPSGIDVPVSVTGALSSGFSPQADFREQTIIDKNTGQSIFVTSIFDLAVASYSVEVNGPIPEPATWALLIAGFAMTGTALRRRRVATGSGC